MRRNEREIINQKEIRGIIEKAQVLHIGMYDGNEIYIVPVNFGYDDGVYYFHGASAGRKYEILKSCPTVGFELEASAQVIGDGDVACIYSELYESVIGTGKVSIITEPEQKRAALIKLMQHSTGRKNYTITEEMLSGVTVYRLDVEKQTCKAHRQ